MRLSLKKTCSRCSAGWYSFGPFTQHCKLGYKTKAENWAGIPREPCPKPLTNAQYREALQQQRRDPW